MIGEIVKVIVDRPSGSYHPEHKDLYYPVNYGYIEGIMAPDGVSYTKEEIFEFVKFQEQYFQSEIKMRDGTIGT